MEKLIKLNFNPKPSTKMHLDLNSCFASIEQQANPLLRNKPIAVAAYVSPGGCILAASVEAKRLGVKTGMRVKDGKLLCRELIVLPNDPEKYREVHRQFRRLLEEYTHKVNPKSIDEFVLDMEGFPSFTKGMATVAKEIKQRIKSEIGEWLRVSVGIAPNAYLAKIGAGLHKPDGLDEINEGNYKEIYSKLALMDLCGIKANNTARLNQMGIYSVMDFFQAPPSTLVAAFGGITGYYWHLRMHGFEVDDVVFGRKSFGNSYALPTTKISPEELAPILNKLTQKTGRRLRKHGYKAAGVHVALLYRDWSHWHHGEKQSELVFDSQDIYKIALHILRRCPYQKPVHTLAVSVFDLEKQFGTQLAMWEDIEKKENLNVALDNINEKWGDYVITPARMMGTAENVQDRIAFGGIKELEDYIKG